VEFDGDEAARQLEQQREAARAERAKTDRDLARLEKELSQAEYAVELALLAVELAQLRAATPKDLIGAIEYEENQLSLERALKDRENTERQLADVAKSLRERRQQADLDARKSELAENWWQEMLKSFTVVATQSGYVIYGNHPWTRAKYQEGDTVRTSFNVAQVADTDSLAIKVWINSVDRPRMEAGAPVNIVFDALPQQRVEGELVHISDSGAKKNDWGVAVYYEGVVLFDDTRVSGLLPGMSALVEPL
ncbi:MAG: HlyD family efflux transporter periplasmic adaptor subunit, partial [Xanthomonadales bacterium]|nr:HlyD family efflux transporter periplasmic adaptor subunit [Xanthomonadales bacterium]